MTLELPKNVIYKMTEVLLSLLYTPTWSEKLKLVFIGMYFFLY